MVQWVNRLRNKIFVNPPPLPLLCEISGALHLAQPGLTAGWQTKYIRLVVSGTALPMHSSRFFRVKPIARLIFKGQNFPEAVQFPTNPYIAIVASMQWYATP